MISNHPLRTLAASKLSLLGCIIVSINILTATVYSYFESRPLLAEMISEYINSPSLTPEQSSHLQDILKYVMPVSVTFGLLISLALSSVPAVALWLIYSGARSSKPHLKPAGFSILNIYLLISVFYLGYSLAVNIFSSIGEESFFDIIASSLESLMNLAMIISARKLVFAARNVIKSGDPVIPVTNRCSILIIINLFISVGTLLLEIAGIIFPERGGQYVFNDLPTRITALSVSVVNIAEFAVFYFLSRNGVDALTNDTQSSTGNSDF